MWDVQQDQTASRRLLTIGPHSFERKEIRVTRGMQAQVTPRLTLDGDRAVSQEPIAVSTRLRTATCLSLQHRLCRGRSTSLVACHRQTSIPLNKRTHRRISVGTIQAGSRQLLIHRRQRQTRHTGVTLRSSLRSPVVRSHDNLAIGPDIASVRLCYQRRRS